MSQTYTVKTASFEGPLDLLLTLIEKRKLFINDISLAEVTDDYISYMSEQERFPLREAADFILIASTLLLIKSKSLIPALTFSDEEEENIEDLERRLALYKRFKTLSKQVSVRFGKHVLFSTLGTQKTDPLFSPDESMTTDSILEGIKAILHNLPKKEIVPKVVVQKVITLDAMIGRLTDRITKGMQTSFKDFSGIGKEEKINVIMSFLAMLELVKQGIVVVKQNELFADITIASENK